MMRKPFGIQRPNAIIPKHRPAVKPGWYKRFRQLAALADKSFKIKP